MAEARETRRHALARGSGRTEDADVHAESMSRRGFAPRWPTYADDVSELERPTTPWSVKATGLVVVGLLAWLLFGSALTVAKAAIALAGYIVVGVAAFMIGRAVGRRGASR